MSLQMVSEYSLFIYCDYWMVKGERKNIKHTPTVVLF